MANITEYRNKEGKLISFQIRIYNKRNNKNIRKTITLEELRNHLGQETISDKKAFRVIEDIASEMEKALSENKLPDSKTTFKNYCDYVINRKEKNGEIKHSTAVRYKDFTKRIYPAIGDMKVSEIATITLNRFYDLLAEPNPKTGKTLSAKTIIEHHRLISSVLAYAKKEKLISENVAEDADTPKLKKHKANYFQLEDIDLILSALAEEPMKWQAITKMLMFTGARRGEILGLKWEAVDFQNNRIHIKNNILYTPDRGIYEDTPKTETSERYITLAPEVMTMLKQYRKWQAYERLRLGSYYKDKGFVFSQDNGEAMHPDSVTDWLGKFSKRHDLPHINPHAFRHTMASVLFYNGVDPVSVSKRLGHAQVSTTANIYAHIMADSDKKNSDILAEALLRKRA